MTKQEIANTEAAETIKMKAAVALRRNDVAPLRRRDIDRKLTARFCADRRANVRAAGETLAAMLDRHDRREFCEARDIESIDTANFYLPAGLMIQWGK